MLDLAFDPRLEPRLVDALVAAARRTGASLDDVEMMSYDARVVEAFVLATAAGEARDFLDALDRERLARLREHALAASWGVARARATVPPRR